MSIKSLIKRIFAHYNVPCQEEYFGKDTVPVDHKVWGDAFLALGTDVMCCFGDAIMREQSLFPNLLRPVKGSICAG